MTIEHDTLAIWTIYARPADLPAHAFVARAHRIGEGGRVTADPDFLTGETLAEVRAKLPPFLFHQRRQPDDDPAIVEVWF